MLVGNGFSMDLRAHFELELDEWDTRSPLAWGLVHPEYRKPLRDLFPRAFQALDGFDGSDFERMTKLVESDGSLDAFPVVELRHYLVMAFSMYQRVVDSLPLDEWRWWPFFDDNSDRLGGIVSLNYDLVVERLVARAGVPWVTPGIPDFPDQWLMSARQQRAFLWKPHGSLDYRPTRGQIEGLRHSYPLRNLVRDNDMSLERVSRNEWTRPRLQADVVVPTERSRYRNFQWVSPGEQWIHATGSRWSTCVIVGLSYAPCDREEIDVVLTSLPKGAEVFVVDPSPNSDLIERLQQLGLVVSCTQVPPVLRP